MIANTRTIHERLDAGRRQIRSVVPKTLHCDPGVDQRDLAAVVWADQRVLSESASFAQARVDWVAALNTPLLDRGHLDRAANALALQYASGIAAIASVLLRERTDELTRRNAFVEHLQAEVSRLKGEVPEALILRAASTAWEQPRNPDGTFGGGDGSGGGNEGQEPQPPSGGKGAPAIGSTPNGTEPADVASLLGQWSASAAFSRAARASIAKGRPSSDAVALLEAVATSERVGYPLYRQIDPTMAIFFAERANVDPNLCSVTRTSPTGAGMILRILPGAHAADCSPFSAFDEGEHLLAGRWQTLDTTDTETVLRQVATFIPGSSWPGRSAAPQQFDVRDALFKLELDALGSFAMDR